MRSGPNPVHLGFAGETTVASASTCDIGAAPTDKVAISGTTTITSFGTVPNVLRFVRFTGALTLTQDAVSLILPGGANIATAAGDACIALSDTSGNWRVLHFWQGASSPIAAIPQVSKSTAYTTVLADAGKHIYHPSSDNNARTFTIDSNANVAYPLGTAITFVNEINTVTIAITSDTLTLQGAGSTGSRSLAANGMATALKVAPTKWVISGTGLT
jgi:hypothetical protein